MCLYHTAIDFFPLVINFLRSNVLQVKSRLYLPRYPEESSGCGKPPSQRSLTWQPVSSLILVILKERPVQSTAY